MRTGFRNKVLALALTGGVLSFAMPSHAQFGGLVLDPTQSAHATTQIINEAKSLSNQATRIAQGSEANMTLGQQLSTDLQLAATALKNYETAMNTYNSIYNNLKYFNAKSLWQTLRNQLTLTAIGNRYGETYGLEMALGGNPQTAGSAWTAMNTALSATSSSFLSGQIVGASNRLATLARVEAMDGVSTQCLAAAASYNAGRLNNQAAEQALQTSQFDVSDSTNSELEQIDMLNVGSSQQMNETQSQGSLQACMAAQAAVGNMEKRNAAAEDINNWSFVQQQRSMADAMPAGSSQTWTTYLP
jgi:hypothetical protein